jgi:hypothetical protein
MQAVGRLKLIEHPDALKAAKGPDSELPPGFEEALARANQQLTTYVSNKSKNLTESTLLGPNFDATNFYRVGDLGTDGFGMSASELARARDQLLKQNFPMMNEDELRLINFTSYGARRRTLPNTHLTVKHFPGGDEMLETTEQHDAHFSDVSSIKRGIGSFDQLIHSRVPPELIMVSHATYESAAFGLNDEQAKMPPAFGGARFAEVPASLNPFIIDYLRDTLGFKGLVIADWYNMGAIRDFLEGHPDIRITTNRNVDIAILATIAGVDYITGLQPEADLLEADSLIAAAGAKIPPDFVARLDASMERIWSKIQHPQDLTLAGLSSGEKLMLKSLNPHYDKRLYAQFSARHPERSAIYDCFWRSAVGDNDIWNRTGVMTLIERQLVVEALTHQKYVALPRSIEEESGWFLELMNDKAFRKVYDKIDWGSQASRDVYARVLERNHP